MNIVCPFIESKSCFIYDNRPAVCREFLVFSPPAECKAGLAGKRAVVDLPIKMAEVLTEVCSILLGQEPQTIFLPLVGAWCENYSKIRDMMFDCEYVCEILVNTLSKHLERNILLPA